MQGADMYTQASLSLMIQYYLDGIRPDDLLRDTLQPVARRYRKPPIVHKADKGLQLGRVEGSRLPNLLLVTFPLEVRALATRDPICLSS